MPLMPLPDPVRPLAGSGVPLGEVCLLPARLVARLTAREEEVGCGCAIVGTSGGDGDGEGEGEGDEVAVAAAAAEVGAPDHDAAAAAAVRDDTGEGLMAGEGAADAGVDADVGAAGDGEGGREGGRDGGRDDPAAAPLLRTGAETPVAGAPADVVASGRVADERAEAGRDAAGVCVAEAVLPAAGTTAVFGATIVPAPAEAGRGFAAGLLAVTVMVADGAACDAAVPEPFEPAAAAVAGRAGEGEGDPGGTGAVSVAEAAVADPGLVTVLERRSLPLAGEVTLEAATVARCKTASCALLISCEAVRRALDPR